jgi:hypothetical protein
MPVAGDKETYPVKSSRNIAKYLALCSATILFVACVNQMEPAKSALDGINATLSAVSTDAQEYVPDQLASAQSKVAGLTASYDKKDYAAVVTSAPAVMAEVNGLAGAVAAKKDERLRALGNEWRSVRATVAYSCANANRLVVKNQARTERHRSYGRQIGTYRCNGGLGERTNRI